MRALLAFAALAGAAGLAACVGAEPGGPPQIGSAGCAAIEAAVGPGSVWYGGFHGQRERASFYDDDLQTIRQRRCFASEPECRAWLYDLQSRYSANVYSAICRPGVPT